jgi:peroxiredoxin
MIAVGERLPEATLMESLEVGDVCPIAPTPVNVLEASRGKRIALFGLPGAFTSTCSLQHVPGYLAKHEALRAKGIDEIWCVSVNDGYVMAAWGKQQGALGKIRFLGDGSADFTRKLGLDRDLSASGMGTRLRRCSMLIEDGVVRSLNLEAPGKFETTDAETFLRQLA